MGLSGRFDRLARVVILAVPIAAIAATAAAEPVSAVTTSGTGVLTKCRHWLVYKSCNKYNKVALPARIAIGDKLTISYGSNNKNYVFEVGDIRSNGEGCRLLNAETDAGEDYENIEIAQCRPASVTARN